MPLHKLARNYLPALFIASTIGAMGQSDENVNALEKRLGIIEARLAALEKKPSNVASIKPSSSSINQATMDILAKSAWRDLRWTDQKQWENLKNGMTTDDVIKLLGKPPRSVKSLKPKVDLVYFYEVGILDASSAVKGKISFKNGVVVDFQTPDFQAVQSYLNKP